MSPTARLRLDARAALHMGTGLCALLLGVLSPTAARVFAVAGVVVGFGVFPLLGVEARVRRPGEGYWTGLKTYPLAVLGLVWLLPPTQAAAAWAILAFGDTAARLVGQAWSTPAIFRHPKLTWSGSAAGVLVGTLAAFGMSQAVHALALLAGHGAPGAPCAWLACAAAASAAGLVDAIPWRPNDNIPVAWAAGLVLALLAP